jgi:hypothetical protein
MGFQQVRRLKTVTAAREFVLGQLANRKICAHWYEFVFLKTRTNRPQVFRSGDTFRAHTTGRLLQVIEPIDD